MATHVYGYSLSGGSKLIELIPIASIGGSVADDAVTNLKLSNMATQTIKGRTTAGTGDPEDLSAAQVRTLLNVADGATANSTDAFLLDRANHTGTQLAATISDFAEALDDRVASLLVAGSNITLTYNDAGNSLTIDAAAGAPGPDVVTNTILANMAEATIKGRQAATGTGDPEDLTAAQVRTILNVADGATANSTDASLRDRATHTGTQLAATISDFAEAVDDRVAVLAVAGTGMTITYNDVANTLTFDASVAASGNFTPGGTGSVARTQDVKLRELGISVLDYGADPTGAADSTTAFNNAQVAAAGYGLRNVYIPAGTYRLDGQWVMNESLTWKGAGRNDTTVRSYFTTGHALDIVGDAGLGSGNLIIMEDFQFENMATQGANMHGVRVARKVQMRNVYVNGFTNDGIWYDTYTGGATGAVFFSEMWSVWSKNNGRDGIRVRAGANANYFYNCQFDSNTDYGFHHLTDGFPTYGNVIIGGQCSYNGLYGYYFESGTDIQAYGLYAERNCCSTPGNTSTDYSNTRLAVADRNWDFYIGDNCSRSWINVGVLFGSSSTHIRAPSRGLNDGCLVMNGGRRIYTSGGTSTAYMTPTEAGAVADVTTANASDLTTVIALSNQLKTTVNSLLGQLRTGNTIAP